MTPDNIAMVAHEVNRAYCASLGDHSQPAWPDAPDWQKASALAGVKMHLANPDATPENSHESWLAAKAADGWKYGPEKDAQKKEHPCFMPYADLPAEQKAKDFLFRGVVHAMKGIAEPAAAPAPSAPAKAPAGLVSVKYIGPRETYKEGAYGSGLVFSQGESLQIPAALAAKLFKHPDVYVPGDPSAAAGPAVEVALPVEDESLKTQPERDSIANMGKNALETYARTHFRVDLDKRKNLNELRAQVTGLVDQYGAPSA